MGHPCWQLRLDTPQKRWGSLRRAHVSASGSASRWAELRLLCVRVTAASSSVVLPVGHLSTCASYPRAVCPTPFSDTALHLERWLSFGRHRSPRGRSPVSGDSGPREGVPGVWWEGPGMLISTPQSPGQPPTEKQADVCSAQAGSPALVPTGWVPRRGSESEKGCVNEYTFQQGDGHLDLQVHEPFPGAWS